MWLIGMMVAAALAYGADSSKADLALKDAGGKKVRLRDLRGKPIAGAGGKKDGLPAWGLPAAFARADGAFVVLY